MKKYDKESISRGFLRRAEDAERYLREVRAKLKDNPSYKHVHDDHLAKFYVYNYLHGRTFLESESMLVAELGRLQALDFPAPREAFSSERFELYRQAYLNEVLTSFENGPSES
ncbi:hypothetical protein SSPSH_000837 [Salinisphaera shabanensis E1L3A]|uniref:Uncharacterized protein n=1 Tax=Salinisphaera shabanensis E1L3A TaxID=1033802 RepID=U2G144_9GAMM|nr:hypothetical protein [Salinisphaera shabanensis]ERJ19973.1 hypothetical protein SSPSH_000837 [Salinisphaera shabanensis E1L3A]